MADNILRLQVDSQEYDSKIKRAAEGIQQYAQKCREVGGTLEHLDDGVLEFVNALGQMDTVANGTKGQLRELTNALTDITLTYRSLTDEEKASPFGQALAANIDILTERAGNAKDAMADVAASIQNASSDTRSFDQMAQGMSVAMAGFQGLTGAGKLLGIEMGNDVEIIAKLQAAMAVTNSLTTIQTALQKQSALMQGIQAAKTTLQAVAQQAYAVATGEATVAQIAFNVAANANPYGLILGTIGLVVGAIGAFVAVMGDSTRETDNAKAAMDDLSASVDAAAESYARLKENIRGLGIGGQKEYKMLKENLTNQKKDLYNRDFDIVDKMHSYERSGNTDDPRYLALKEQHEKIAEEAKKVKKEMADLDKANNDRVNRINKYARLDFNDISSESEVTSALNFIKEQMKYKDNTSSDYANLKRAKEYAENILLPQFQDPSERKTSTKNSTGMTSRQSKPTALEGSIDYQTQRVQELTKAWRAVTNAQDRANLKEQLDAANKVLDEMTGKVKTVNSEMVKGTSGFNEQNISNWTAMMKSDLAKADYGSELYNSISASMSGMSILTTTVQDAIKMGLQIPQDAVEQMFETIFDGGSLPEDMYHDMIQKFVKDFKEQKGGELTVGDNGSLSEKTPTDKQDKKEQKQEKSVSEGIGQLSNGMQQMVGSMQQLGFDIPAGLNDVLGGIQSVVSILTAISTIVSAIQAISAADALLPFANGGIVHAAGGYVVPGNKFSGDLIPAALSSGEMVLNRLQQGVLADALQGSAFGNMNLETEIRGESIRLVMNNNGRRTGKGEYVQSRKIS